MAAKNGGDRKSVGFATHIIAGGSAGAMEAVRAPPLELSRNLGAYIVPLAVLPTFGHDQGSCNSWMTRFI